MPGHTMTASTAWETGSRNCESVRAALGKTTSVTLNLGRLDFVDRYADLGVDRVAYELSGRLNEEECGNSRRTWEDGSGGR